MKPQNKIVIGSVAIALGFWIVDAIIDVTFFGGESFLGELILHPSPYEIYIRSLGTAFTLIPGIVMSRLYAAKVAAEEKLKDSETRYRRLFETAQDSILILNGDTGQIIDANPFIKDMLGFSMEELKGKKLWDAKFQ